MQPASDPFQKAVHVDGSPFASQGLKRFFRRDVMRVAEITALSTMLCYSAAEGFASPALEALPQAFAFYGIWGVVGATIEHPVRDLLKTTSDCAILRRPSGLKLDFVDLKNRMQAASVLNTLKIRYGVNGVVSGALCFLIGVAPVGIAVFCGLNAYLCHRREKDLMEGRLMVRRAGEALPR